MRRLGGKPWNSARATFYGAAIGTVAAAFKLAAPWNAPHPLAAIVRELIGAAHGDLTLPGVRE